MRLTMIRDERGYNQIMINGDMREIPELPDSVPFKVQAVQVYTAYTEVENADLSNDVHADPPAYVHDLVKAWEDKKAEDEAAQQAAAEAEEDETSDEPEGSD